MGHCLLCQHEDLSSVPKTHGILFGLLFIFLCLFLLLKKQEWILLIAAMRRKGQVGPWGSLVSRASLFHEFESCERFYLLRKDTQSEEGHFGLHMHVYTCVHTYVSVPTNMYTPPHKQKSIKTGKRFDYTFLQKKCTNDLQAHEDCPGHWLLWNKNQSLNKTLPHIP